MDPISVNTAVAMANAFRSYIEGDPGEYTVTYKNTRYTLTSAQNPLRNGPLVTFKLEQKDGELWDMLMHFDGVSGVFATDCLVIVAGSGIVRISYEVPQEFTGDYTVQPVPPTPMPVPSPPGPVERFQP